MPQRYYLDLPWLGQKIKLYSDKEGYPLDSYARAERLLNAIRYEIDLKKFDPRDFVKRELKSLEFSNYAAVWLARRRLEAERNLISWEYLRKITGFVNNYLIPHFDRRSLRDIIEGQIEDLLISLPRELAPKTVANILGCLKKIFTDAHRRKDILRMPDFPRVEVGQPVTKWITEEEQARILANIKTRFVMPFSFSSCARAVVPVGPGP